MEEKRCWLGWCEKTGVELAIVTEGEHDPEGSRHSIEIGCPLECDDVMHTLARVSEWQYERATNDSDEEVDVLA